MTDKVVVKVICAADGSPTPHDGRYVVAWNPHTEAGTLELSSTTDPAKAHQFASKGHALLEWQTQSVVQPLRPWDHRPNRPLTGVHCEIMPITDARTLQ